MGLFYPTSLQQSCASTELFEALRCSKVLSDIKHHILNYIYYNLNLWKLPVFEKKNCFSRDVNYTRLP